MSKINRGELLREIYGNSIHGGIAKHASFTEFGSRGFNYRDNGHQGSDVFPESTGGLFAYRVNKSGFIGNDFINNPDILALGCSVTAGIGIKTEYSWPHLISQQTGMTFNQGGLSGASIQQLESLFFEFIDEYGLPKYVLLLAPELTRHWVYEQSHSMRSRSYFDEELGFFRCFDKDSTFKMDVDSSKIDFCTVAQNSFRSLTNISIACKLLGIKYHFFSWMREDNALYSEYDFPGYAHDLRQSTKDFQQLHYVPNQENKPYWLLGMDKSHAGVCEHYYYRDRFMRAIGLLNEDSLTVA